VLIAVSQLSAQILPIPIANHQVNSLQLLRPRNVSQVRFHVRHTSAPNCVNYLAHPCRALARFSRHNDFPPEVLDNPDFKSNES
jgi:hypothetical protein